MNLFNCFGECNWKTNLNISCLLSFSACDMTDRLAYLSTRHQLILIIHLTWSTSVICWRIRLFESLENNMNWESQASWALSLQIYDTVASFCDLNWCKLCYMNPIIIYVCSVRIIILYLAFLLSWCIMSSIIRSCQLSQVCCACTLFHTKWYIAP